MYVLELITKTKVLTAITPSVVLSECFFSKDRQPPLLSVEAIMEAIDTCIILDQWNTRTFLTITTCQYGKKELFQCTG